MKTFFLFLIFIFCSVICMNAQSNEQTISSVDSSSRKSKELILSDGTTTKKIRATYKIDGQNRHEGEKKSAPQSQQIITTSKND